MQFTLFVMTVCAAAVFWKLGETTRALSIEADRTKVNALADENVGFVGVNALGDIVEWSCGCEKLSGWTAKETFGRSIGDFAPCHQREENATRFAQAVREWPQQTKQVGYELVGKGGQRLAVSISARASGGGKFLGVMSQR